MVRYSPERSRYELAFVSGHNLGRAINQLRVCTSMAAAGGVIAFGQATSRHRSQGRFSSPQWLLLGPVWRILTAPKSPALRDHIVAHVSLAPPAYRTVRGTEAPPSAEPLLLSTPLHFFAAMRDHSPSNPAPSGLSTSVPFLPPILLASASANFYPEEVGKVCPNKSPPSRGLFHF
jgi:hypothetical protein